MKYPQVDELNRTVVLNSDGLTMYNIHKRGHCLGGHCWIHNPSNHNMRDFPILYRYDRGILERTCSHGIGHPDPDDQEFHLANGADESIGIHGCDGCCR